MIKIKVHFYNGSNTCYVEDFAELNSVGLYEYNGYLHLRSMKIKMKDVIHKEVEWIDE